MPIIIANLTNPFARFPPTEVKDGNYIFSPNKFRFRIVSPVQNPWGQKWLIKIRIDFAKPRDKSLRWASAMRLLLEESDKPADSTMEWISDRGKFFYYQTPEDRPALPILHIYVLPGAENVGWLGLIIRGKN